MCLRYYISNQLRTEIDVSIIAQGVLSSVTGDPTKTRCQVKVCVKQKKQVEYQVTQSSFLVRKTYISPLIIISHTRQIHPSIHPSSPLKKSRTNTLPRPGARLHDPGHVRSRVQDVIVELARVERRPLVRALRTSAPLEDAVRHRERGPLVRLHGVLGIREVAVLQAHVRRAPRVVPVAGYAAEVVVVQVRVLQVVGARVPLVRPVEPVVVDRALRCDVVCPAYVGFWC